MAERAHTELYLHLIWATQGRTSLISPDLEPVLFRFLGFKAEALGCDPRAIGGTSDHVHMLTSLRGSLAVSRLVAELKGASSHLVNHELGFQGRFAWQPGYGAFTVATGELAAVERYVVDQKKHHAAGTIRPGIECAIDLARDSITGPRRMADSAAPG